MPKLKSCFVIMPSGKHNEYERGIKESDFVYKQIIVPAVRSSLGDDVVITREADRRVPGAITKEIVRNTVTADIAIVDITGQNPNVFFELGIRYSLRRNSTILLRQDKTEIPFDISNYRCVTYDPHFHNDEHARRELSDAIQSAISSGERKSDSLVFDVFEALYVDIPGVLQSEQDSSGPILMKWSDYWRQLKKVVEAIRDQFQNGRYVPSIIIGISNGGLMYGDLLGRELFHRVPVVALWANRWSKEAEYFDSELNGALLEAISNSMGERGAEILLVDDIVASGYTLTQALNYLKKKLPKASISFLPLFCKNEKYFDNIRDNLIWFKEQFRLDEKQAKDMHGTTELKLPYEKDIRSS